MPNPPTVAHIIAAVAAAFDVPEQVLTRRYSAHGLRGRSKFPFALIAYFSYHHFGHTQIAIGEAWGGRDRTSVRYWLTKAEHLAEDLPDEWARGMRIVRAELGKRHDGLAFTERKPIPAKLLADLAGLGADG